MPDLPVLLSTDGPSLLFPDEKQASQFELGVACAVFLWDDLNTAVASNWGGPDSAAKREWLAGAIVELFEATEVGTDDVEYRLLAAMEDEFDVTIETGTAYHVAEQIIKVYQEVADQKYELVQQLFEKFQNYQPAQQVTVQEDENDDNSEESEAEDDDDDDEMDCEPQLVDAKPRNEPIMDEDGFIVVPTKGRR